MRYIDMFQDVTSLQIALDDCRKLLADSEVKRRFNGSINATVLVTKPGVQNIEGWKMQVDNSRRRIAALEELELRKSEAGNAMEVSTRMWEIERLGHEVQGRDATLVALKMTTRVTSKAVKDLEKSQHQLQEQDFAVAKLHADVDLLQDQNGRYEAVVKEWKVGVMRDRGRCLLTALIYPIIGKEYAVRLDRATSCPVCLERSLKPWLQRYPMYRQSQSENEAHIIAADQGEAPHPAYTCPECRAEVKSAPIRAHSFEDIVALIARLLGDESSDGRETASAEGDHGHSGAGLGRSAFDEFFPV
ncbi:uncharacterized protein B0H18DRAFT_956954 [Fomitopsis serialis]|uniref:uncharacterized protein n=1 Tax=Fomitopsis serialis TaxID=139415 RepID=UPI002008BCB2|nr:uncharacterized protein B0H18DRAFT_956954 [Neoantrodia serialis]KAH9920693.1 hypothetical protein B0H18DRAFT_956954 [Neoantrodia serialis]